MARRKQNIQNRTLVTISIHKHKNKNTKLTKLKYKKNTNIYTMIKKNQKNIKEYDKRKRVEDIQPPPVYDCPSLSITILYSKVQGKSVPLQAWGGPEGSRNLRFPDFRTIGI